MYAVRMLHPLTACAVPSPYEQGESAMRRVFCISLYSIICDTFNISPLCKSRVI